MKKVYIRKSNNVEMIKKEYSLSPTVREFLTATETKEEVDAYFEHIYHCIGEEICADCGQPVNLDGEFYRAEHVKEYSISGLCRECQIKAFGA